VGTGESAVELSVGDEAPDFVLRDIQNREIRLKDYEGKVVLLDFWATWCGPCVQLMPFYEELQAEDHGFELVILTLNLESAKKAKQFMEERELTLTALVDSDKKVMVQYGVSAIPDAILIDPEGVIRARFIGWGKKLSLREALAEERIRQYLSRGGNT